MSDAFFSAFSIESISFSPSVFEQICLVAVVSSGGGGAWKDGGWGFVKETGPQESFLFRRETGVDGVGIRLSFAAKTSHVLLGPRESPPQLAAGRWDHVSRPD